VSGEEAFLVKVEPSTGDNCREFQDAEELRSLYERLDGSIHKDCARFAEHLVRAEVTLKSGLIPKLAEMQALLSQRGSEHTLKLMKELGLPTWTAYITGICRELNINIRAVQRALKRFREPRKRPPKGEKEKPVVLTKKQQRRLLEASVAANDALQAMHHGGDIYPRSRSTRRSLLIPRSSVRCWRMMPRTPLSPSALNWRRQF
jgi:hypothetical protein